MVTLEVGIDAKGLVMGARDAMQSLNQMSNSVGHLVSLLENVSGTAGSVGKFGAAVARWQPMLLVATTAFSAINLAISAFRRTTDEATDSAVKFSAAWSDIFARGEVAGMFGDQAGVLAAGRARIEQMQRAAEAIFASGKDVTAEDLARMSGMNPQMVMQRWAQVSQPDLWRSMGGLQGSSFSEPEWGQTSIRPREAVQILAGRQRELRAELPAMGSPDSPYGLGPMFRPDSSGGFFLDEFSGVRIGEADQFRVDEENRMAAARQLQAEMMEMEQRAQRIGDTLASGFMRAATGAASVKQIIGEMLMDMAQSFLAEGFTNAARGFMSGFGATPTQKAT